MPDLLYLYSTCNCTSAYVDWSSYLRYRAEQVTERTSRSTPSSRYSVSSEPSLPLDVLVPSPHLSESAGGPLSGTDLPYSGHARSMSYTDQLEAAFAARSPVQTSIPSYYYSGQRMVTSSAIKTAARLAAVRMPFEPPTTVIQPILPAQAPVSRMSRIIHGVRILMDKKDRSHVKSMAKETLTKQGTHPGPSKLLGVPKSFQAIVYTDFAAALPHYKQPITLQLDDGCRFTMSMHSERSSENNVEICPYQ